MTPRDDGPAWAVPMAIIIGLAIVAAVIELIGAAK